MIVWGEDRDAAVQRMTRSLQDFVISGVRTNLPLYQRIMQDPDFLAGGLYDRIFAAFAAVQHS